MDIERERENNTDEKKECVKETTQHTHTQHTHKTHTHTYIHSTHTHTHRERDRRGNDG